MTRRLGVRHRLVVVVIGSAFGALGLNACSSSAPVTTAGSPFPTPLATSLETSEGTWATVPMGHPNDPKNTFWQLFFRPSGAAEYSNQVEATATATNGGLVLADQGGHELVVGIRPSQQLHFTPMIATADAGVSWTDGLLDASLGSSPSALAVSPSGDALGIVSSGSDESEVMASVGGFSSWRSLLRANTLASEPSGRTCSPSAFSAVGYVGTTALLGATCRRPDARAIFVSQGSGWHETGPDPASSRENRKAEVLGLYGDPSGAAALLGYSGPRGDELVASWTPEGTRWEASIPLPVARGDHLVSYGATSAGGLIVLLSGSHGSEHLYEIDGPGMAWSELPAPPPTTATVASADGGLDALAVDDTVLSVWRLGSSGKWTPSQTLHVSIQFGSSN